MSVLDQPLAFVDLETTGTHSGFDRITEVGIVTLTDGVVEEWSSLVDPECRVPPMIEALTGITSEMVRGAPTFARLAGEVLQRLDGRLFIAHNARFDYGFLKAGFARLGQRFQPKVLCTARLSRKLFPEFERHNLDSLIGQKKRVIIAAHGNSLRALVKHLDQVSEKDIVALNIPTGIPLVYELDEKLAPLKSYYLGDPEAAKQAAEAVAQQTQKK